MQILQTVNLLKHKNPYTGLTYAEDPAVAFIEIINEQSILFYTSTAPLKASATLRQMTAERFSDWLRAKYGSHEKLVAAWGDKAFDGFANEGFPAVGEHLDKRNILPIGNPWYWDPDQLNGSQAFRRQRLLDTMQFLYELQCGFYDRYVQAMRDAGYQGEILGSNWQAGRAISHYYNLHSDWRVGTIDRHNYFGGGSAKPGAKFNNATMLHTAGSGTLSVGLQQASDRPFMLSEWIHVFPSEWGVEGPGDPRRLRLRPAGLGRLLHVPEPRRRDVQRPHRPGPVGRDGPAGARHLPRRRPAGPARRCQGIRALRRRCTCTCRRWLRTSSASSTGPCRSTMSRASIPTRSLPAPWPSPAARSSSPTSTATRPPLIITPFAKDGFVTSSTGQLQWKEAGEEKLGGHFTIDTPGTKAVVGFAEGRQIQLGNVTITPQCPFAAIYVTAREPDKTIDTSGKLLITAIARARNSGMQFNDAGDGLLDRGKPPILMEPVKATITIRKSGQPKVYLLTHDGLRTGKTLPIADGTLTLDTARDKTPYYLMEFTAE